MSVPIRTAEPRDLPALLLLYQALNPADAPLPEAQARPIFDALHTSELAHLLVAERDGAVVATCLLLVVPNFTRGGRAVAVSENVVTRAVLRGQGLGTALIHAAFERAWAANCYKVMLATGRSDEAVLRFYEKAGFTRGGKTFFEARRV